MKKDFQEVLNYYKEKLKGRPIDEITSIAQSAYKNVRIDRANRVGLSLDFF